MKFFYRAAVLPKDDKLLMHINMAATRLYNKLSSLNLNLLDISDYNKRYLGENLKNIRSRLQKYSYILSWSVAHTNVPLKRFVCVDYGGGPGILSLLAKEVGIGTVIYNDIYDVSCRDARLVGQTINNEASHYVHGGIDELVDFIKGNSIQCHAISSYDVIEHIYDIESFMTKLCYLSEPPFNIVMASGANPYNPVIRKMLMRKQKKIEYGDRKKKWGHKERDSLRAYFSVRKEIISQHAPSLSDSEVDRLARVTRGLIESKIRECVEEYLRSGEIRREPDHPTNTCDPYTGNWAERLIDVSPLKEILSNGGFRVDIMSGYGGSSNNIIKSLIGSFVNPLVCISRDKGLVFAPFYTIYARKLKSSTDEVT